ncbi:MAG: DoxX family protein [Gemmatimonadetes bacterium]|nr:DoxX family protein [Gemmatimonadota bacterium]NIU30045.1 DoxX family protein [Gemmatimonadota bacterium]NIV60450.1 DoxX family membrane protein [Gemmatimonadota bacterium]NIW63116.1 DoxX family membrane protein [Gemmatimonadota bacterium]NIY06810.1 DoxX family membrane protein [Gemmatimonadota bacterium]
MEILHLIGRVIFGGFFIYNGLNHFMNLGMMKGYAGSKDVPAPGLAVTVTGLMLVVGGLSVLLGLWPEIGLWLLIVFLIPVSFLMHDFWAVPEEQKVSEMTNFMKNMALLGAALMMLETSSAWTYTLGG